ncbi:MAG: DUF805 domain-containing protein [Gallionellaceae bacterium]|nr:DUF805 domain-containing protein [Gallionellaceae bacterium]
MPISQLFFSFAGRITRQSYWLSTLALSAVILVPAFFYFGIGTETAESYVDVASLVLFWPLLAVQAKRWHDRDKAAWWILIALIPVIGFFWAIIEIGFLPGTSGQNRFGANPNQTNPQA